MILNIVLLISFIYTQVFGYYTGDQESSTSEFTSRFANFDVLALNNTVVKITIFRGGNDKVGIVIPYDTYHYDEIVSSVDSSKKTIVMFNGHPSADSVEPYAALRKAFFATENVNIISVFIDWTKHHITFLDSLKLAESLSMIVIDILKHFNIPTVNYHLIGHCAGSEIAAFVARTIKKVSGQKVPRLTVFDPFVSNATILLHSNENVDFVEVYHAGIYSPPFFPIGHVDFYPNAGVKQPGCNNRDPVKKLVCHHQRSIYLYVESMYSKVNALEGEFDLYNRHLEVKDKPITVTFGYMVDKQMTGAFYLPTHDTEPYLMSYF